MKNPKNSRCPVAVHGYYVHRNIMPGHSFKGPWASQAVE